MLNQTLANSQNQQVLKKVHDEILSSIEHIYKNFEQQPKNQSTTVYTESKKFLSRVKEGKKTVGEILKDLQQFCDQKDTLCLGIKPAEKQPIETFFQSLIALFTTQSIKGINLVKILNLEAGLAKGSSNVVIGNDSKTEVSELNNRLSKAQSDLDILTLEKTKFELQLKNRNAEIEKLKEVIQTVLSEVTDRSTVVQPGELGGLALLQQYVDKLKGENKQLLMKNMEIEKRIQSKEQEVDSYSNKLSQIEAEKDELKKTNSTLFGQLETANGKLAEVGKELEMSKKGVDELKQQLQAEKDAHMVDVAKIVELEKALQKNKTNEYVESKDIEMKKGVSNISAFISPTTPMTIKGSPKRKEFTARSSSPEGPSLKKSFHNGSTGGSLLDVIENKQKENNRGREFSISKGGEQFTRASRSGIVTRNGFFSDSFEAERNKLINIIGNDRFNNFIYLALEALKRVPKENAYESVRDFLEKVTIYLCYGRHCIPSILWSNPVIKLQSSYLALGEQLKILPQEVSSNITKLVNNINGNINESLELQEKAEPLSKTERTDLYNLIHHKTGDTATKHCLFEFMPDATHDERVKAIDSIVKIVNSNNTIQQQSSIARNKI